MNRKPTVIFIIPPAMLPSVDAPKTVETEILFNSNALIQYKWSVKTRNNWYAICKREIHKLKYSFSVVKCRFRQI